MEATFYRFSKKVNSTAIPSGSGRTFEIHLKDVCSVTAPVIRLHASAFSYNYCYIPAFGRYYFVSSTRILLNNMIEYTLAVDVLASYKSQILSNSLYVLRSASDYNLFMPDETWVHTTDFTETVQTKALPGYDSEGMYLVSIVGSPQNTVGQSANPASTLYAMSPLRLKDLLKIMFDLDQGPYSSLQDLALTATYFNPFQYITSCRWLPFDYDTFVASQNVDWQPLMYGWFDSGMSAYILKDHGRRITQTLTVGAYNDWTDRDNNWTRYVLYIPSCGLVEIDAAYSGKSVTVNLDVDYNTGQTFATVIDGAGKILAQTSGILGSEVAINQISTELNIPNSVGGAIAAGAQIAGGAVARGGGAIKDTVVNFFHMAGAGASLSYGQGAAMTSEQRMSAAADAASYVPATIEAGKEAAKAVAESALQTFLNPTVTKAGADGCRYTIMQNHDFILYRRKYARYNAGTAPQLGGVCNRIRTLSGLSGYTVVANGVINIPGLLEERNAICSMLEGGFYIE